MDHVKDLQNATSAPASYNVSKSSNNIVDISLAPRLIGDSFNIR